MARWEGTPVLWLLTVGTLLGISLGASLYRGGHRLAGLCFIAVPVVMVAVFWRRTSRP
jgi:hypothetical protein